MIAGDINLNIEYFYNPSDSLYIIGNHNSIAGDKHGCFANTDENQHVFMLSGSIPPPLPVRSSTRRIVLWKHFYHYDEKIFKTQMNIFVTY